LNVPICYVDEEIKPHEPTTAAPGVKLRSYATGSLRSKINFGRTRNNRNEKFDLMQLSLSSSPLMKNSLL